MKTQYFKLVIDAACRSDIGFLRDNQEDAWYFNLNKNVYVVCDGMGGHAAGEVAAEEAVATYSRLVESLSIDFSKQPCAVVVDEVAALVEQTNALVHALAQTNERLRGMGTTFCCIFFHEAEIVVAHVGDSRVYRLRQGRLEPLTEDHSLHQHLVDGKSHTKRSIITRAIGTEASVVPTVERYSVEPNDKLLICSDGLSDMVSDRYIEEALRENVSPQEHVDRLIDLALAAGGLDNVTVMVIEVGADDR